MWRKVTESDLTAALSQSEIEAFRRSATFEADPVHGGIRQVCSLVRGCIRTGGARVRMSRDEEALPESLIQPAMDYLRHNILTRMNVEVNASRTKAYENACELFRKLAAGEFVPESDTENPEPAADDPGDRALSPAAASAEPARLLD